MSYSIEQIKQAVTLTNFDGHAAHKKMMPVLTGTTYRPTTSPTARIGSVLIMLYCRQSEIHIVLTRRRDNLSAHAGQISFPGGKHDPPETLPTTALRETEEEVGIAPSLLTVLGQLTPLYILPSDFEVYPYVAWYHNGKQPNFKPNSDEVAEIIEVPLRHLLDSHTRATERRHIQGLDVHVPYFAVAKHKVWGATAMMLSEFLERLRYLDSIGVSSLLTRQSDDG